MEDTVDTHWDTIVVGAGSAGAVVAARCAAAGQRTLLLESGPDYRSAQMPEAWRSANPLRALLEPPAELRLLQNDLYTRRTDAQGLAPYVQGRGAGGGSSVNGHIAIRPPMDDYADWAASGCTGWGPDDVLPYLVKLENDVNFGDAPYHGTGGPIPICRNSPDRIGSVDRALRDAGLAAGFTWTDDINAPGATGLAPYPINSSNSLRVSTNDGYLEPARSLLNLTVRGETVVDKVLFSGNAAVGVHAVDDRRSVELRADRVVLSAGAIHSPAILHRSGIGPADDLRAHNIDVHLDLPVGHGLQDHALVFLGVPLSEDTAVQTIDDRYTNTCLRYTSGHPAGQPDDMMIVACNQNVLSLANADLRHGAGALLVWLNQAYSTGTVKLASADPVTQPTIRHRMLSDERDLARLRDGARLLVELGRSDVVQDITDGAFDDVNKSLLAVLDRDSDLNEHLLAVAADGQHATSTCRMGNINDATTVVDSGCRVHGTENLYVADASILPTCPRANPNIATIMAGELLADRLVGAQTATSYRRP